VKDRLRGRLDPLRILVCLLIILVVSRVHQYIPLLAKARPLLVLTALSALYAFSNPRLLIRDSVFSTWPAKVIAGIGIMSVLAVPFGISMGNSGKFVLEVFWKTILLAFLIIASCRTARDLYAYAWSYVIGALILSYFALFFFDLQRYGTDFSYARLSGLATWDANDVVLVLMPALACALLVYQVAKPRGRWVALMALVGIGATVARSGSRGGLIGLVAVGVALLFFGRGVSLFKRVLTIGVVAAGLSLWAPQGYWKQMESILSPKEDYNYTSKDGRKEVAKRGIGYMLSRPIFGLGIGNFQKAECTISEKARTTPAGWGIRCMPPHNSFVQAGAELGVPGLVLWASIPLYGIVALLRLGRRLPYRWRGGTREERFLRLACPYLAVALVGFTATSFFLNFAWLEPYYVLAALVASLMAVNARRVKEQRMELHMAALAGSSLQQEAAAILAEPVPVLPGQARYPRPLVMLPTARLRPGDLSSW
jgi:O-antigen ligase